MKVTVRKWKNGYCTILVNIETLQHACTICHYCSIKALPSDINEENIVLVPPTNKIYRLKKKVSRRKLKELIITEKYPSYVETKTRFPGPESSYTYDLDL